MAAFHLIIYGRFWVITEDEVEDLDNQLAEMKARRSMIIRRPKPATAFDGRRIAWILTAEKLLVEMLEKNKRQLP